MNHVITFNYSMRPDQLPGAWIMLRSLVRHAPDTKIHVLIGPKVKRIDFPPEVELEMIPLTEGDVNKQHWIKDTAFLRNIPLVDYVFWCDMRDVYFQSSPFTPELLAEPRVSAFAENAFFSCTREGANRRWQWTLHKGVIPEYLNGKPAVCFGTHAGQWIMLKEHFRIIWKWMQTTPAFTGRDQAMYTTLAWGHPEAYHVWSNESGPVMHCVLQPPVRESMESIRVYNMSSQIPAVVHQFDRYPQLAELVMKEYLK